ncbi:MAG: hypothetical protein ACFFBI_06005 [Promethearchaeota archaeon]
MVSGNLLWSLCYSGQSSQWFDNVELITFEEYCELFGIDDNYIRKCDKFLGFGDLSTSESKLGVDNLLKKILNQPSTVRDSYMDLLLELYEKARVFLNNWNQMNLFNFL